MGEVINVVVAFAVIVFFFRWATKGGGGGSGDESQRRARDLLGFHPKNVTQDMISTVQTMFPDIPRDNIHYDLLKTGSVQATSNKLLERGYLEAPPQPYFQLYPTQPAVATAAAQSGTAPEQAAAASGSSSAAKANLIARYNLEERLHAQDEGKGAEEALPGGKAAWEDTAERREASLRERKAQMVLAARKRFLEQQQQQEAGA